jgi:hypothetical protein
MKLYVFSSTNIENIRIGVQAETWAVPRPVKESVLFGYQTKASKIEIGSFGIFWCQRNLTTPFIILSRPDQHSAVPNLWPGGDWVMPFRIRPLGSPHLQWSGRRAARTLPSLKPRGRNLSRLFKQMQPFNPVGIGDADWALIVSMLVDPPRSNTAIVIRETSPAAPFVHLSSAPRIGDPGLDRTNDHLIKSSSQRV